jgi:cysteine desulfurase
LSERVYLDWNATAPLRPEAEAAMRVALALAGNPSSVHAEGRAARAMVEAARVEVAALVAAHAQDVTFTSGGTEAMVMALCPRAADRDGAGADLLLVGASEHPCALAGGRFSPDAIRAIPLGADGRIAPDRLDTLLAQARAAGARPLVAIQLANNETGVVQDIPALSEIAHAHGAALVCDGVQAAGKIAIDIDALGADLLVLSAHKIGGPQGVGALVRRAGGLVAGRALITGGGQEKGLRAGTQNVAGIAGFGAAAKAARAEAGEAGARMQALRDLMEADITTRLPQARVVAKAAPRLPNTTLLTCEGLEAATLLIRLDLACFAVSSGSACSSGKVTPSHVLLAMGVPASEAASAIRVSLGHGTAEDEVIRFARAYEKALRDLSERRGRRAA